VLTCENLGAFLAVYIAKVCITVQAGGTTIVREGMDREKVGLPPQAKPTTQPLRLPRPTPPSGDRSDLSSIAG
jgi:hypothetical protein